MPIWFVSSPIRSAIYVARVVGPVRTIVTGCLALLLVKKGSVAFPCMCNARLSLASDKMLLAANCDYFKAK